MEKNSLPPQRDDRTTNTYPTATIQKTRLQRFLMLWLEIMMSDIGITTGEGGNAYWTHVRMDPATLIAMGDRADYLEYGRRFFPPEIRSQKAPLGIKWPQPISLLIRDGAYHWNQIVAWEDVRIGSWEWEGWGFTGYELSPRLDAIMSATRGIPRAWDGPPPSVQAGWCETRHVSNAADDDADIEWGWGIDEVISPDPTWPVDPLLSPTIPNEALLEVLEIPEWPMEDDRWITLDR